MSQQVLIVDDDPVQRRLLDAQVRRMGYRPLVCDDGAAALGALERDAAAGEIGAMVLDLVMPGLGGLEVLAAMRRSGSAVPVIVQTARSGIETVVAAMRAGAFDFIVKPASPDKLQAMIAHAVRMKAAVHGSSRPVGTAVPAAARDRGAGLEPARSRAMRPVIAEAAKAAGSDIPVLLEGETGVGKEWLADAIRAAGPRAAGPFVVVNCGALPQQLAESILFGHEKGAFTDAGEGRPGKFLQADRGTLFLDEVGELPLGVQVKLLRVLQDGEIDPVGARTARTAVDVRVISATNRDLAAEVRAGRFREDLYYRLNVFPIRVPPLRERREEIADLAARFLRRFAGREEGGKAGGLSAAAMELLTRYDWPGNIRQLENVIRRAVVLGEDELLEVGDFPQVAAFLDGNAFDAPAGALPAAAGPAVPHRGEPAPPPFPVRLSPDLDAFDALGEVRTVDAIEADLIRLAMTRYGGRMSEVARRLGIGRSTLYRKMRQYSIAEPAGR